MIDPRPDRRASGAALATLGAITVLAALLRCSALDYGGGVWAAHPDELNVVTAIDAARAGKLSPFHVAYGGGFVYPLSTFVRTVELAFGTPAASPANDATDYLGQPYAEYLHARLWSATLAVLTVALTGVVGARVAGWPAGLLAAAMVTAAPLAVLNAHLAKADSACALGSVLVLGALALRGSSRRRILALGLAAGLALSVKYHAGPLLAVAIALLALPATRPSVRAAHLAGGVAIAVLAALALNAFWIWAPAESLAHFRALVRSQFAYVRAPWFAGLAVDPLVYHATISLRFGCGLVFALLALPALLFAVFSDATLRLFVLVVVGELAVLAFNPLTLSRNFLPVLPTLAVLVGHLLARVADRLGRYRLAFLVLAGVALVCGPLRTSVKLVELLRADDTRTLLQRWIAERLPANATFMSGDGKAGAPRYGLPGSGIGLAQGEHRMVPFDLDRPRPSPAYLVWYEHPLPFSQAPLPPAAAQLEVAAEFDPFDGPVDAVFDVYDAFYVPLARAAHVVRPGPHIRVLALPDQPPA